VRQVEREKEINRLLGSGAHQLPVHEEHSQDANQAAGEVKKVKITFDEYQRIAMMIIAFMKEQEQNG
jgi:hypothetical protein